MLGGHRVELDSGDRTTLWGESDEVARAAPGFEHPPPGEAQVCDDGPDRLDHLGRGVVGVDGGPPGGRPLLLGEQRRAVRPGPKQIEGCPRRTLRGPRPSSAQRARVTCSASVAALPSACSSRRARSAARFARVFASAPEGARSCCPVGRNPSLTTGPAVLGC